MTQEILLGPAILLLEPLCECLEHKGLKRWIGMRFEKGCEAPFVE